MKAFLAAVVIFGIAFLGMAISVFRKKQSQCFGCSCKAANRIMNQIQSDDCSSCPVDSD